MQCEHTNTCVQVRVDYGRCASLARAAHLFYEMKNTGLLRLFAKLYRINHLSIRRPESAIEFTKKYTIIADFAIALTICDSHVIWFATKKVNIILFSNPLILIYHFFARQFSKRKKYSKN